MKNTNRLTELATLIKTIKAIEVTDLGPVDYNIADCFAELTITLADGSTIKTSSIPDELSYALVWAAGDFDDWQSMFSEDNDYPRDEDEYELDRLQLANDALDELLEQYGTSFITAVVIDTLFDEYWQCGAETGTLLDYDTLDNDDEAVEIHLVYGVLDGAKTETLNIWVMNNYFGECDLHNRFNLNELDAAIAEYQRTIKTINDRTKRAA